MPALGSNSEVTYIAGSEKPLSECPYTLIHCISTSVVGENGEKYGTLSYDMPVMYNCEDSTIVPSAVESINQYFENEYNEFLDGDTTHIFWEMIEDRSSPYGTSKSPFEQYLYKIKSEITYQDSDYLSIYQTMYWNCGGVNSFDDFGHVLNLTTGEKMCLSQFISCGDEEFQAKLFHFLFAEIELPTTMSYDEFVMSFAQPQLEQYEFYLDGDSIYIILKDHLHTQLNYIVRWSTSNQNPIEVVPSSAYIMALEENE